MSAFLREGQDVRRVGYKFELFPPPGISQEAEVTQRIRAEVMPNFCPLWLTRLWQYPTGKEFETVHVVIARMEIHPPSGARIVKGLKPGPNGEKYRVIDIVNGLTADENAQGFIGRYMPLSEMFEAIKIGMRNLEAERDWTDASLEIAADNRQRAEEREADEKAFASKVLDRLKDRRKQILGIPTTYVSSRLTKLKKAAGAAIRRSPKNHATMPRGSGKPPADTAESMA